jgi:FMN-dependent oxidoreductase (nitrilotriacetate monooxygenase family)
LPGNQIERALDLSFYIELAQKSEAAGFDALFHADKLNLPPDKWDHLLSPLEPITLFSALAAHTEHIGLVATASTTYSEPFNLARQFATLDHISHGRAGWNVVTSGLPQAAANFGDTAPDHSGRYLRAAEFVEVFKALCLSWEPEAIVIDRSTGVQTDMSRIHEIDHVGTHFNVKGPLDTPRPPQGYPVLFQAGQSQDGLAVACKHSEALFCVANNIERSVDFYRSVKSMVASFGRNPDHFKILPGLITIMGSTEEEARRLQRDLREAAGQGENAEQLSRILGIDLETADPDDVVDFTKMEKVGYSGSTQSWHSVLYAELSGRHSLTVRETLALLESAGRSGHFQIIGTPEHVADVLEDWYRRQATDGFLLQPVPVPTGAYDFFDNVVPLLEKRGVYQRYGDSAVTLRERMGIPLEAATVSAERI